MKRLADELGTGAAHSDTAGISAADENGCDAAEALEISGIAPRTAIGSEGGDEAGPLAGPFPAISRRTMYAINLAERLGARPAGPGRDS